ncbi:hypothetical protein SEA_CAMERICO_81 [Gordonia phage Camerico]|nr:hypothetical protein SEA_CAMERICO_81 [Gordonia phage Camerico]
MTRHKHRFENPIPLVLWAGDTADSRFWEPIGDSQHFQGFDSEDRQASTPEEHYYAELDRLQTVNRMYNKAPQRILFETLTEAYFWAWLPNEYRMYAAIYRFCEVCDAEPGDFCLRMNKEENHHAYCLPHKARYKGAIGSIPVEPSFAMEGMRKKRVIRWR